MNIDRFVMGMAGSIVVISLLLYLVHSPYWLWLTAAVGVNLLQASITGFCPIVRVLKAFGIRPGPAFE